MPPPTHDPAPSTAARHLRLIIDAFSCSICHAPLSAPVQLPCAHIFCSECLRRHLASHSSCPHPHCKANATATLITPLRGVDIALDAVRTAAGVPSRRGSVASSGAHATPHPGDTRMTFLSRNGAGARGRFVERLRTNGLPVGGALEALAARDREFVIKWNANQDRALPLAKKAVAEAVMAEEQSREAESRRQAMKVGQISEKSFFTSRTSKPREGGERASVPEEGDGFSALIRKLRMRQGGRKRMRRPECKDDRDGLPGKLAKTADVICVDDVNISDHRALKGDDELSMVPPSPPSLPLSPSCDQAAECIAGKFRDEAQQAVPKTQSLSEGASQPKQRQPRTTIIAEDHSSLDKPVTDYSKRTGGMPSMPSKSARRPCAKQSTGEDSNDGTHEGVRRNEVLTSKMFSKANGSDSDGVFMLSTSDPHETARAVDNKQSKSPTGVYKKPNKAADFVVTPTKSLTNAEEYASAQRSTLCHSPTNPPLPGVSLAGTDISARNAAQWSQITPPSSGKLQRGPSMNRREQSPLTESSAERGDANISQEGGLQSSIVLSDEQRQRIERNRQIAQERKRRFRERLEREHMRQPDL